MTFGVVPIVLCAVAVLLIVIWTAPALLAKFRTRASTIVDPAAIRAAIQKLAETVDAQLDKLHGNLQPVSDSAEKMFSSILTLLQNIRIQVDEARQLIGNDPELAQALSMVESALLVLLTKVVKVAVLTPPPSPAPKPDPAPAKGA